MGPVKTYEVRPVEIGGQLVLPGERQRVDLPIARLPTQSEVTLPVAVVNGVAPGPHMWISAAIHGDELNGVEVIRRVLDKIKPTTLHGTLYAIPIVNVFGFLNGSRYLPDRRDLNRSFPGSRSGSMASRLAHVFMSQIVDRSTFGIDLHTAGTGNINAPQIRANLGDAATRACAKAFGAPIVIDARMRDGSLRQAAAKRGAHTLLYEAGEPLKFNDDAINIGVRGVLNVMRHLGMILGATKAAAVKPPSLYSTSSWVRARASGICRLKVGLQDEVRSGQDIGTIADALGDNAVPIVAPLTGVVIGMTTNPLVSQGDAIVHIATEKR